MQSRDLNRSLGFRSSESVSQTPGKNSAVETGSFKATGAATVSSRQLADHPVEEGGRGTLGSPGCAGPFSGRMWCLPPSSAVGHCCLWVSVYAWGQVWG